ncbi:MAG: hypothetical protein O8C67_02025 [Candidatus Methanoperedens sp.]|nr:hypothetical protein [Candidatus Methanoperedens sp.]
MWYTEKEASEFIFCPTKVNGQFCQGTLCSWWRKERRWNEGEGRSELMGYCGVAGRPQEDIE